MLRPLLKYAQEDAKVTALADAARSAPQRAFVSASLRGVTTQEPPRAAHASGTSDRAA